MPWDDNKYAAFDVETSGELNEYALQPFRVVGSKAWVTSFAYANRIKHTEDADNTMKAGGFAAPEHNHPFTKAAIAAWLKTAVEHNITVVTWNGAFDIAWLIAYGFTAEVFKLNWIDGMLLWRHLDIEPEYDTVRDKKRSYSLKEAVRQFLPQYAGYEADVDFHDMSPEMVAKRFAYNKKDAIFTLLVTKAIYEKLEQENPRGLRAALIEAKCLPMVAEAGVSGMCVDLSAVRELDATLERTAAECLKELEPHGVTEKIVRSPKQLEKLLFDDWCLPSLKLSAVGSRSTDKEVLHELAFIDPRAKVLRTYREALNNRTKFADTILKSAEYNGDGMTRPQHVVFGTYTGRMTISSKQGKNKDARQTGFALHQMKRGKEFRASIKAPPGYTLCELDAAGQEFRWMAIASRDENMLRLCLPGEDPHGYMGAQIVGQDYRTLVQQVHEEVKAAKDSRQLGKVANLSCIAAGQKVLTDRGYVRIEDVTIQDMLWDGVEWVPHGGLVFNGYREVISYAGLTATPDHRVLVTGHWVEFQEAAQMGWQIESPLGQGWAYRARAAVRIVDGIVRRAVRTVWGAVRNVSVRLRGREGSQPEVHGDGAIHWLSGMRNNAATPPEREAHSRHAGQETAAEARECDASAVHEPKRQVVQELRWARHRVSIRLREGWGRLLARAVPYAQLCGLRHRQDRQQWSLRAGQSAIRNAPREPRKQATYDILNAGPRSRFSVGACIVHNCQYRTSAPKLRSVARVQYNIPMEIEQARMIRRVYLETYPGVPQYWEDQIAVCSKRGYVETFAGRRVQLRDSFDGDRGWQLASTTINYRIQGTGADQKYLALAVLRPYMVKEGIHFAWELHDGIYLYVPNDKVLRCVPELRRMLGALPYKQAWGFDPPIPLPWDAKTGPSWGALKEWSE